MLNMSRFLWAAGLAVALAFTGADSTPAQEGLAPEQARAGAEADMEVLTRGPVHEAYLQPGAIQPEPGEAVPKAPPDPIPEQPPEERPEGPNVEWIPGYWAWDVERQDFLWVSGTYRNAPEGRQWVPGHWVNSAEDWRWVPGFWAAAGQEEIPYTPEPPAPLETEPSLPPPNDNSVYVPGYWAYRDSRFAWRPGYYAPYRENHVWVAPRYQWTPAGYVFCDGYWDYPLEHRGVLFAPVYFHRPLWSLVANWLFRPSYCVDHHILYDSCFYRPHASHFFFGNYYGHDHFRRGYHHRYAHDNHYRRSHHDHAFDHYRWRNHRNDSTWLARQGRLYDDRVAGRVAAPPKTLVQQNQIVNVQNKNVVNVQNKNKVVVALKDVRNQSNDRLRLVNANPQQLERARANQQRQRELVQVRNKVENIPVARSSGKNVQGNQVTKSLKLPQHLVQGSRKGAVSGASPALRNTPRDLAAPAAPPKQPRPLAIEPSVKQTAPAAKATSRSTTKAAKPAPGISKQPSSTPNSLRAPASRSAPQPKVTAPRPEPQPKANAVRAAPKASAPATRSARPKVSAPKPTPQPKANAVRAAPKASAPKPTPQPKASAVRAAPKASAPRSSPAPKATVPRPAPKPKASAERAAPNASAPRPAAPKKVAPRSAPAPKASAPRSAPRSVAPASSRPRASASAPSRSRSSAASSQSKGGNKGAKKKK